MTTPATRLYTVSRVIGHTLSLVGAAQATDAADAVRVALGLTRRPALDHSGPDGSGYAVGRRRGERGHIARGRRTDARW